MTIKQTIHNIVNYIKAAFVRVFHTLAPPASVPASPATESPRPSVSAVPADAVHVPAVTSTKHPSRQRLAWNKTHRVVIDGTNTLFWKAKGAGTGKPSLVALLALCSFLKRHGVEYVVYFDASTRYLLRDRGEDGEAEVYSHLIKDANDRFREVPPGTIADIAVLNDASEPHDDGKVGIFITRDQYLDHFERFPIAGDPSHRLTAYSKRNGIFFPSVGWFVPLTNVA